ncbi:MAG: TlyA family RNA methyltransferase [Myxococcota bacterium]
MKKKKSRLDQLLVERGLYPDLKTAQGFILAGKVVVDEQVVSTPGTAVAHTAEVLLRERLERYASRGGLKLEAAIHRFGLDFRDRVVLDAGASTGGFTDCALQHGAKRVYAVDVGFGQLRGKLASDPRVESRERTNVSDLTAASFDPPIERAVFDLSYLSITKSAPIVAALFVPPAAVDMVGLIKPLYEGVPQEDKAGLQAIQAALVRIFDSLDGSGLEVRALIPSPILGGKGAIELLAWIGGGGRSDRALIPQAIAEAAQSFVNVAT